MERRPVRFEPSDVPDGAPVTKLGGQPVWLSHPQWPLSASLGTPMSFIGQFELTGLGDGQPRMAYVFMTPHFERYVEFTWEPEGGENAVIIQPGGRVPAAVDVTPLSESGHGGWELVPVDVPVEDVGDQWEFIGGQPNWLQGDETPGPGWQLIMQLTDRYGHNFGDGGIAYAFLSPDGREGRFLWQCH